MRFHIHRPSTTLIASLIAIVGLVQIGGVAVADEQPGALDTSAVDAYLGDQIGAGLPGAAVAITKGDQVLHVQGYGHDSTGAEITVRHLLSQTRA